MKIETIENKIELMTEEIGFTKVITCSVLLSTPYSNAPYPSG